MNGDAALDGLLCVFPADLLDRLETYLVANDDDDENFDLALGAAAVLRSLRDGELDADLANLIYIVNDDEDAG